MVLERKIVCTLQEIALKIPPCMQVSPDWLFELCAVNRDLRISQDAKTGAIAVERPSGWESDRQGDVIAGQVRVWTDSNGLGQSTGSSGGFLIPEASRHPMVPDVAWTSRERLQQDPRELRRKFLPIHPDFVVEVASPSDSLPELQGKMEEWISLGVRLGWLIDSERLQVYVYRPGETVEVLENPASIAGDPVLPGFVLDLTNVWDDGLD